MSTGLAESTVAAMLARLDERTGAMQQSLNRVEDGIEQRFASQQASIERNAKQVADLEEKTDKRLSALEEWKNRATGVLILAVLILPALTAYLTRHLP